MTFPQQWNDAVGLTAVDADGAKIGTVGQIYLSDVTEQPEWVTVSVGKLGTRESFAPLYNSAVRDDQLVLAVPKQMVKNAPSVANDGHLDEPEVAALYDYYAGYLGEATTGTRQSVDESHGGRHAGDAPDQDTYGQDTQGQAGGGAMTRSEEGVHVGTENAAIGRARLRKYVVTENVSTTVPVTHEEVRVQREPVTEQVRKEQIDDPDVGSPTRGQDR
jgi:stress response protein YsnF